MNETPTTTAVGKPFTTLTPRSVGVVALLGLGVGLLIGALLMVLTRYVFSPLVCGDENYCGAAQNFSVIASYLVGALISLFLLVRIRTYRPLLVVLAVTISLWTVPTLLLQTTEPVGIIVFAGIFTLAFTLFTMLASLRNFYLSAALIAALAVVVRLISQV